jgi:aquaporin Z
MEAGVLGIFMISACAVTVLLFHPDSPAMHLVPGTTLQRLLMGLSMGLTAVGIIKCPWGKSSGSHFNPAITLTFLRLGKIHTADASST